jgi:hypothetical protein
MENYFNLIPSEINDLIVIYVSEFDPLHLWETNLFNEQYSNKYIWKRIFEYNSFPIFNRDLYYYFNNVEIANKKFKKYTSNQLFKIILTEFLIMESAKSSYVDIIDKKFTIEIPFDYINDALILYDNIIFEEDTQDLTDTELNYLDSKWTSPFNSDDNKFQTSYPYLRIDKNNVISYYIKYGSNNINIEVKDKNKFLKELLYHIFYHRLKVDIQFY